MRSYKHPYIREWKHPKRGDDTYRQTKATIKKLKTAQGFSKKRDVVVVYGKKEYSISSFLKKHPKWKTK